MIGNSSPIAREYMQHGRSATCPIIDMHGHFGPFHGGYLPAALREAMIEALDRAGVQRIVISAHEALFADPIYGNALAQETINAHPEHFLGYWLVNPNHRQLVKSASADFERARGFVGFKFLPDYHTVPVTASQYAPVLEYADAQRLPILIHTWGGSGFDSPQIIEQAARKYPNAILIMGHSGFGDWENAVRVAANYPNVYLELTAVYVAHDWSMLPTGSGTPVPFMPCLQVNGIIEYMVEHATSKKIVFGTDMPWYSPHFAAGAVLFARIDDEARHDILHRNAERLLGAHLSLESEIA